MRFIVLITIYLFSHMVAMGQETKSTKEATIEFVSEAPLELISALSNECNGILNTKNNQFAFRVKIRSFEGFNSPLQKEHFNENYLESEEMPYATYFGTILNNIDYSQVGESIVTLKGGLEIHGVEDERVLDLSINILEDGSIEFSSEFEIALEVHNIDVPSIVYQKISEVIQVSVKGILK